MVCQVCRPLKQVGFAGKNCLLGCPWYFANGLFFPYILLSMVFPQLTNDRYDHFHGHPIRNFKDALPKTSPAL